MTRVKRIVLAALILSSLEFLAPSLFTNGIFYRSAQPTPALLNAASRDDAGAKNRHPGNNGRSIRP